MLGLAFGVLSAAASLGIMLLVIQQRGRTVLGIAPGRIAITHGLLGTAGALILLLAFSKGVMSGKAAFDSLGLLGAGLAGGLAIAWLAGRGRSAPGALIALHAAIAGFGYLLLAGFVLS